MKRFIINITFFILIILCYFGLNMFVNHLIYKNHQVSLNEHSIIIAGDSHTLKSIDPEYLQNARNISQTAEPYIITFWKLKKVFESFKPDTLILGFAPHNISEFNDLKFSDKKWASEMFNRSYSIFNIKEISGKISISYLYYLKALWKQTALFPKRDHINYIGKYLNNKKSDVSDWDEVIHRHYYYNGSELGYSETAINYLDSIVNLCDSNEIELVLVGNPLHSTYLKNIPVSIKNRYNEISSRYEDDLIIFDKKEAFYPDSLYYNSDHLNELGAKRFTTELIQFFKD